MNEIGLWQIVDSEPKRLDKGSLELEKHLEDWIEQSPELLQKGLEIIGRQIHLDGGTLDLLAIDPQGQWIVIELKAGAVRRDTISQVIDYSSSIATMPYEDLAQKANAYLATKQKTLGEILEQRGVDEKELEGGRDTLMYIVGTGKAPGLERMVSFLAENNELPINIVIFEVFKLGSDEQLLLRELTETEIGYPAFERKRMPTIDELLANADQFATKDDFRKIYEAALRHNLYPRPYKVSIMYAPISNKSRTLLTVPVTPKKDGTIRIYVASSGFMEFFPVPEETTLELLGEDGWYSMESQEVKQFIEKLDSFFAEVASQDADSS